MQKGRGRRPVDFETLRAWERQVFDTHPPLTPPFGVERQALGEWGFDYNPTRDEDRIALRSASWNWLTACVWVAWQTFDGAASGVAAFRMWRGRIWREGEFDIRPGRLMSLPDAELALRTELEAGRIEADAVRDGAIVPIAKAEWPRLAWEQAEDGEVIEFCRLLMLREPRYEGLTLARAAMMRLWPAKDGWAPDHADPSQQSVEERLEAAEPGSPTLVVEDQPPVPQTKRARSGAKRGPRTNIRETMIPRMLNDLRSGKLSMHGKHVVLPTLYGGGKTTCREAFLQAVSEFQIAANPD